MISQIGIKKDFNIQGVKKLLSKYGVFIALTLLLFLNVAITPNFLSIKTLWNLIIQSSVVMLIALGMTIVISTGGIDISVGSTMALCGVVLTSIMNKSIFLAVIFTILTGLIAGILNGLIIQHFKIQSIIVTLATMTSLRGIAQALTKGKIIEISNEGFSSFSHYKVFSKIPIQLFIVVIAVLIIYIVVKKTPFGRHVEAIGGSYKAAETSGVNIFKVVLLTYGICGAFAGCGAVLDAARLSSVNVNTMGKLIEFDIVSSVAVGGTLLSGGKPRILNSVAGAFLMELITVTVNMNNIDYSYSLIIKTMIIIIAVAIQKLEKAN